MATDKQVCSPLDFFLAPYGYTYEQVFFVQLGGLALNKTSPPEVEKIRHSLHFWTWQILDYMHTSCLPQEMLASLFSTILHTPRADTDSNGMDTALYRCDPSFPDQRAQSRSLNLSQFVEDQNGPGTSQIHPF